MFHWLYHGKNRKQCYHEPGCIVCVIRFFFALLRLWKDDRGIHPQKELI